MEILLRALIGGLVVSAFALLGDLFQPKRFAGLFGAVPSVALASLGLAIASAGKLYVALEARSMAVCIRGYDEVQAGGADVLAADDHNMGRRGLGGVDVVAALSTR